MYRPRVKLEVSTARITSDKAGTVCSLHHASIEGRAVGAREGGEERGARESRGGRWVRRSAGVCVVVEGGKG